MTLQGLTGVAVRGGLAMALSIGLSTPLAGQAGSRQFFMLLTDGAGEPVRDLTADELRLEQGTAQCRVLSLEPDSGGMKVALLVDNSAPAQNSLNSLRQGLRDFLDTLPAQHEVGFFTIGGQARMRSDFTTDREALRTEADNLFAEGSAGTLLLDGLIETWERRFDDDDSWPVFVLMVYDGSEASRSVQDAEFNEFTGQLLTRAATAHAIVVTSSGGGSGVQIDVSLFLTENTGGVYRALAAANGIPEALTDVATAMGEQYDEVKDRYRVVYECDDTDPTAGIGIAVARQGLSVNLYPDRKRQQ